MDLESNRLAEDARNVDGAARIDNVLPQQPLRSVIVLGAGAIGAISYDVTNWLVRSIVEPRATIRIKRATTI